MKLKVYTAPTIEPVTLDEAKLALSIDGTARDTQVTAAIVAARELVEEYTNRALITQTLEAAFDEVPGRMVEVPRPNLLTVVSVTAYDEYNDDTVVSADDYHVDTYAEPGVVALANGSEWTTATPRPVNALVIRYTAGYGATAATVPRALREAIIEHVRAIIDGDPDAEARARRMAKPYRIPPV